MLRQVVEETRSIRKKARPQARAETRKRRSDHLPERSGFLQEHFLVKHQCFGPRDELHIRAHLKQESSNINRGSAPTNHCHATAAIGLKIRMLKAVR